MKGRLRRYGNTVVEVREPVSLAEGELAIFNKGNRISWRARGSRKQLIDCRFLNRVKPPTRMFRFRERWHPLRRNRRNEYISKGDQQDSESKRYPDSSHILVTVRPAPMAF